MKTSYKTVGLSVLVGFLLFAGNLFAIEPSKFTTTNRTFTIDKVQRNFTLEQQVSVRAKKIGLQLQPKTRKKLDTISQRLLRQLISSHSNIDVYSLTQRLIQKEFSKISDEQTELLTVYVISGLMGEMEKKLNSKDGMLKMSLRLQMTMDRRSKFISTLSNILKKISTAQDTLVQNIK